MQARTRARLAARQCVLLGAVLALAGCSVLPGGTSAPVRRDSPPSTPSTASVAAGPSGQCFAQLGREGVTFTPLPDRYLDSGCTNIGTVQMSAVRSDTANLAVTNLGPVTCPVAQAFAGWARYGVDRAARQMLGSPLRSIETFGSYSCRNVAGSGRRSAHATAAAIDISAFVLEDGRRISVQGDWNGGNRQERQFLRVVQESACKRFATVLGPEYNAAHRDHFHLEGVMSGRSFCR